MPMISYAQNQEDVLLSRLFPRGVSGFYVDVGANDPVENSITKHFYDLGWHGVNVEPAAEPFAKLAAVRTRDVNLNVGLSDQEGTLTFHEFPPGVSAVSTFSDEHATSHGVGGLPSVAREVEVTTLARICDRHVGDRAVDFLSVDVEGHERQVLLGGDWKRWRPRVVIVEATIPTTTIPSHDEWENVLLDADYVFAAFDGLNRYYVRSEDEHLAAGLSTPVNVTDDYMPYQYSKPIHDLKWRGDDLERQLAAARAVNQSLRAELGALPAELSLLRAQYERSERSLEALRARCEALLAAHADVRADYEAVLQDVGSDGLGVARRLTRLSRRFPQAATLAKRGARVGLRVKRTVGGGRTEG